MHFVNMRLMQDDEIDPTRFEIVISSRRPMGRCG